MLENPDLYVLTIIFKINNLIKQNLLKILY